jgi:hypothetical protein
MYEACLNEYWYNCWNTVQYNTCVDCVVVLLCFVVVVGKRRRRTVVERGSYGIVCRQMIGGDDGKSWRSSIRFDLVATRPWRRFARVGTICRSIGESLWRPLACCPTVRYCVVCLRQSMRHSQECQLVPSKNSFQSSGEVGLGQLYRYSSSLYLY